MQSNVYDVQSNVYDIQNNIYDVQSIIYDIQSNIYDIQSNIHDIQSNIYDVRSNIYDIESNIYDIQSNIYDVQSKIYDIHSTLELNRNVHCAFGCSRINCAVGTEKHSAGGSCKCVEKTQRNPMSGQRRGKHKTQFHAGLSRRIWLVNLF